MHAHADSYPSDAACPTGRDSDHGTVELGQGEAVAFVGRNRGTDRRNSAEAVPATVSFDFLASFSTLTGNTDDRIIAEW